MPHATNNQKSLKSDWSTTVVRLHPAKIPGFADHCITLSTNRGLESYQTSNIGDDENPITNFKYFVIKNKTSIFTN